MKLNFSLLIRSFPSSPGKRKSPSRWWAVCKNKSPSLWWAAFSTSHHASFSTLPFRQVAVRSPSLSLAHSLWSIGVPITGSILGFFFNLSDMFIITYRTRKYKLNFYFSSYYIVRKIGWCLKGVSLPGSPADHQRPNHSCGKPWLRDFRLNIHYWIMINQYWMSTQYPIRTPGTAACQCGRWVAMWRFTQYAILLTQ